MGRNWPFFVLGLSLIACGTSEDTPTGTESSTPTPTAAVTPTPATPTPSPTATPNTPPTATVERPEVRENSVALEVSVNDADGDLIDLLILYSVDGFVFQEASLKQGSGNYLQLSPGTTTEFLWDAQEDLYDGDTTVTAEEQFTNVTLRVVPTDGINNGGYVTSRAFEYPAEAYLSTGDGGDGGDGGGDGEGPDLGEEGGFESPELEDNRGDLDFNDGESADNREEEYLLVVVNTGDDGTYYIGERSELPELTPTPSPTPADDGPGPLGAKITPDPAPLSDLWSAAKVAYAKAHPAKPTGKAVYAEPGSDTVAEFKVLSSLERERYKTIRAVLAAQGDTLEIWVDQDIPLDWDNDCDGVINVDAGDELDSFGRDSYGFDSCDLEGVARIFSDNILTNLHNVFGYESDIDGSGAVTVLISPILNTLTLTNDSPDDDDEVVEVLAYPEVDLTEYDPQSNPGSNGQEIFYLPAPDPAGFFNSEAGGGGEEAIEQYLTFTMAANLSRAGQSLISYNNHVLLNEGTKEVNWLDKALGTLAADLNGFGAQVYEPLYEYIPLTQFQSLTGVEGDDLVAAKPYMMLRYMYDRFGTSFITDLIDSKSVGLENLENTINTASDGVVTLEDVLLDFATNLYLQDRRDAEGDPFLDPDVVPPFLPATTIPLEGSAAYPGAEGYQQGLNVFGENIFRTRSGDFLVTEGRWVMGGADWSHYAPGTLFASPIEGGFGIHAVRIGGLIQKESTLAIASTTDIATRLIRLPGPPEGRQTFITEQIFGALSTQPMLLPLRDDNWSSVALGEIDPSESLVTIDDGEEVEVADTDLFEIDLRDSEESVVTLEIMAVRKIVGGKVPELNKIFLALAPLGDVPNAERIEGLLCDESGQEIDYPNSYPAYLAAQTILSSTLVDEDDLPGTYSAGGFSEGDVCDSDDDGLPDDQELTPEGLVGQIATWQVQHGGGASSVTLGNFYPYDQGYVNYVSLDAIDDDDTPYADAELGINTARAEAGEEAYLRVELPAGEANHQYLVIVGGPGSQGPYELTLRRLGEDEL